MLTLAFNALIYISSHLSICSNYDVLTPKPTHPYNFLRNVHIHLFKILLKEILKVNSIHQNQNLYSVLSVEYFGAHCM